MKRGAQKHSKIRKKVNNAQKPEVERKHGKLKEKKKCKKEGERKRIKNKKRQGGDCLQKEIDNQA